MIKIYKMLVNKHGNGVVAQTFYGKWLPDMTNGINQMFIYCDEVLPSIVGNTKSQLLARVSIQSEGQGSRTLCTYTPPDVPRQLIK
jgi:hypothetical protein